MRRIFFSLVIASMTMAANVESSYASSIQSKYNRSRELAKMGRWSDAREEIANVKSGDFKISNIEARRLDYTSLLGAFEIKSKWADLILEDFVDRHVDAPYHTNLLLVQGVSKVERGEMGDAYELLSQIKAKNLTRAESEEYNIRMGYLLMLREDYQTALHHFAQIKESSRYYSHAAYYSAYVAYIEGEYKVAKARFEAMMEDETYGDFAPYYLMQIEFALDNYQQTIDYGSELLAQTDDESKVDISRLLAESYFRLGENLKAITYIDDYSSGGGKLTRDENYIKGFSLHELGRYEQAIEPLKSACGTDDVMTQNASFHLANCYLHTGDKRGALKAFALSADDKFNAQIAEESLFNYAKLQYELDEGFFNETINVLSRYISKYDDAKRVAIAQTLLVAAYYNSRDYESAYDNISSIKRPDSEILAAKQRITYLRGLEQFTAKNYVEAAKYLQESIDIGVSVKDIALATFWLGEIDYIKGDYDGAIKNYNSYLSRAPKTIPTTTTSQYSIAYALMQKGSYNSALNYFNNYTSATQHTEDRLMSDAYNRKGDLYYSKRDFANATLNYQKSLATAPSVNNYASYQIAMIEGIQGRTTQKIALLKQIADSDSGTHIDKAHYEMGRSYIGLSAYQSAVNTLLQFVNKYPRSVLYAQALSDLGVSYVNMNNTKSALKYYDLAIKASPQSQLAKDAMLGIREIYVSQGDAQGYFKYAKSIGMEGDLNAVARDSLSFASARGLYLSGGEGGVSRDKAAEALAKYIEEYANGYYLSDALYYLSDCYVKLKENQKAITTLTTLSNRGQSQYSERLYGMLSRLTYEEKMYLQSADASRKLYDVAQELESRHEAMSVYVDATMMSKDETAITTMYKEVISLGAAKVGNEAFLEAQYARATQLRERGEREAALVVYEELSLNDLSKHQSEASFYVIEDAFRSGLRDVAKQSIFKFADNASPEPYWLAKAFILLGDIYVMEEDSFQARATYQSIVDGYSVSDDGIIDEAKSKISNLK